MPNRAAGLSAWAARDRLAHRRERRMDCATAARVSTYPALGMYRCSPGVSEPAIRRISATNSLGGSITGLPSERSNTFSAPCFCVSSVPTSNIRLIHPPSCIDRRVLFDTAILAPVVPKN